MGVSQKYSNHLVNLQNGHGKSIQRIQVRKPKQSNNNLYVTSKNEFSNSLIHELKVLHKTQRAFKKLLFNGVLVHFYHFKKKI